MQCMCPPALFCVQLDFLSAFSSQAGFFEKEEKKRYNPQIVTSKKFHL